MVYEREPSKPTRNKMNNLRDLKHSEEVNIKTWYTTWKKKEM